MLSYPNVILCQCPPVSMSSYAIHPLHDILRQRMDPISLSPLSCSLYSIYLTAPKAPLLHMYPSAPPFTCFSITTASCVNLSAQLIEAGTTLTKLKALEMSPGSSSSLQPSLHTAVPGHPPHFPAIFTTLAQGRSPSPPPLKYHGLIIRLIAWVTWG